MVSLKKWNKYCLLAIVPVLFIAFLVFCFADNKVRLKESHQSIAANGISTVYYEIEYANPIKRKMMTFHKPFEVQWIKGNDLTEMVRDEKGIFLKGKMNEGNVEFLIKTESQELKGELRLILSYADSDGDGFPDVAELETENDRQSFLEWFTIIAESQFYKMSDSWPKIHQDCSGLIFFAYKEALKIHDSNWYHKFPYLANTNVSDVTKYHYPEIPILKDKPFRIASGSFKIEDLGNGVFSNFANASNLLNYNMEFIGKDGSLLKKGDILFYRQEDSQTMPYHSMIYTGENDYLIYHTGPMDQKKSGEVRKVKMQTLLAHPDNRWHPTESNPAFLGIFRWKIVM